MLYDESGNKVDKIGFGTLEVGKSKDITIFFKNEDVGMFNIEELNIDDEDIKILPFEKNVKPGDTIPITLRWISTLKIKKPLDTKLTVKGHYIY